MKITKNAELVLSRRYLVKDEAGKPTELLDKQGIFYRQVALQQEANQWRLE